MSFTSHWMIQYLTFKNQQSTNYKTLITLVNNKVLSESMAKRVAGSGLNYSHLYTTYQRGGLDSLRQLFTEETSNGSVRVTKSSRIMNSVFEFFNSSVNDNV